MSNQNSFYAVWMDGWDLPSIFDAHSAAKANCETLAMRYPGKKVWLLKLEVISGCTFPVNAIQWSKE